MSSLKLYGVPLSQPFRSVAWTLLQRHQPFDIVLTVPGMTSKIGALNESFLSRTKGRIGQVPMLEVITATQGTGENLCISESPAILAHVCERYGWNQDDSMLYDRPGSPRKALIDSYLSWHHRGTRELALLVRPLIRPDLKLDANDSQAQEKAKMVLGSLNNGWLQGDDVYIAGGEKPSIADMLAYEEVAQINMTGLLLDEELERDFPNVMTWVRSMQKVPYHDAIHESLRVLGDLADTNDNQTPIAKRLGAATKAGLQAIKEAQQMDSGSGSSKL